MLASLGDLIHDVAVRGAAQIAPATDTMCRIDHRLGGSAANVAMAAAALTGRARFIGRTGDDPIGAWLRAELAECGVEVKGQVAGRSGTVVALIDPDGERSMLTDRGSSADLAQPARDWVEGIRILHVPFYSLAGGALAETATRLVAWAHLDGVGVSVDASSTAVMRSFGLDPFVERVRELRPFVVFCNEDEGHLLGDRAHPEELGAAVLVLRHGPHPTEVRVPGGAAEFVTVPPLAEVGDTTGAGDAFAAGFLTAAMNDASPIASADAGNQAAVSHIRSQR